MKHLNSAVDVQISSNEREKASDLIARVLTSQGQSKANAKSGA